MDKIVLMVMIAAVAVRKSTDEEDAHEQHTSR